MLLPLCVFLLDASETNYSGFRGAIDQARQRWREVQSWMMTSFHGPVYEWKVRQWAVNARRGDAWMLQRHGEGRRSGNLPFLHSSLDLTPPPTGS